MKERISEKDCAINYSVRKHCHFDYENHWEEMVNSLPKKNG